MQYIETKRLHRRHGEQLVGSRSTELLLHELVDVVQKQQDRLVHPQVVQRQTSYDGDNQQIAPIKQIFLQVSIGRQATNEYKNRG